jgi:NAD(P)-dependent dehydrogenase (short-subunit alcohol dehydrogenase family)
MAKVMLITGASRGIGAATARLAAKRGWNIAVNYASNRGAAEAVVADIANSGRKAIAIQADIGKPEDVARLFKTVDTELGRLDAFFNNAGIVEKASKFVDIAPERLHRILAVNTVGAFIAAQEATRRMSTRLGGKGGVIVNMSSMAAKLGGSSESTDYATAKGAIDSLTIGLAKELASEGIRVNAVRPGLIYTDLHARAGERERHSSPVGKPVRVNPRAVDVVARRQRVYQLRNEPDIPDQPGPFACLPGPGAVPAHAGWVDHDESFLVGDLGEARHRLDLVGRHQIAMQHDDERRLAQIRRHIGKHLQAARIGAEVLYPHQRAAQAMRLAAPEISETVEMIQFRNTAQEIDILGERHRKLLR